MAPRMVEMAVRKTGAVPNLAAAVVCSGGSGVEAGATDLMDSLVSVDIYSKLGETGWKQNALRLWVGPGFVPDNTKTQRLNHSLALDGQAGLNVTMPR